MTIRKTVQELAKQAGLLSCESSEVPQASDGLAALCLGSVSPVGNTVLKQRVAPITSYRLLGLPWGWAQKTRHLSVLMLFNVFIPLQIE